MIIKSLSVWKDGRNYINGQPLAHFVWNHYNPNNKQRKGYLIHHKNGDILNDHISNLQLLTKSEHSTFHKTRENLSQTTLLKMSKAMKGNQKHLGYKHSDDTKKKLSDFHRGTKLSEETKKKIGLKSKGNKYNLGKKASEETKKKMSESRKGENHRMFGKHHSEETKRKISESSK